MEGIRILIVDDHRMFRQGLAGLFQSEPEFEVVSEAASGEDALRLAATLKPDVVLVDLIMPDMTGPELISRLAERSPELGVVVLTASEDQRSLISAIQAGARGYVLKISGADSLFHVIRQVNSGGAGFCHVSAPRVLNILRNLTTSKIPNVPLTPREQEVIALIAEGADNSEIANKLVISENTVKTHVSHLLEKLDMRSRNDLAAWSHSERIKY